MKLWQKNSEDNNLEENLINGKVERFTVGNDRELDLLLARYDVIGSIAHTEMLVSVGLLDKKEFVLLKTEMLSILEIIDKGEFVIEKGVEDVHSQVEIMLTKTLGEIGKKIHTGRSRNDQVLLDNKLFFRDYIGVLLTKVEPLFAVLIEKAQKYRECLIPGYTHFQIAMPSSIGLWLSAYAESLIDDLEILLGAYRVVNKNPLGSAAGYGSSFPLDREMTTKLLGFEDLNVNSIYAQMGRGKVEYSLSSALSSVAGTLSKLAMDNTLFLSQNLGFISYPSNLTTGSSIMPHKKNPDVWELIRAKANILQSLPAQVLMVKNNLPSGYHRDYQMLKDLMYPALTSLLDIIDMATLMLDNLSVVDNVLDNKMYDYVFSVEVVNDFVKEGLSFREAYQRVGQMIEKGEFMPNREVLHSHIGSVGNLCLDRLNKSFKDKIELFDMKKSNSDIDKLLEK